ncbi:MAG: dephospho-CoA kinase [candidate division WOR-3 bacterium]
MKKNKVVIGVGGNIGSGKTTVAKIFQSYGMKYISADRIGKSILPEIADQLRSYFGKDIFSGKKIDRRKLRSIVFSDPKYLKILNNLSHPRLIEKINKEIDGIDKGMVVVDAALLFDWPALLKKVDFPILVKAAIEIKQKRAQKRGIPKKIFFSILKSQKKESEMTKAAKYVIENNGTLWQLKRQCQKIVKELKNDC